MSSINAIEWTSKSVIDQIAELFQDLSKDNPTPHFYSNPLSQTLKLQHQQPLIHLILGKRPKVNLISGPLTPKLN